MSGRLSQKDFAEREEFLELLDAHLKRTNSRKPEHGDYLKPFAPEPYNGALLFDKMTERNPQEIFGFDDDIEGDVLVLDPSKIGKKLPNFLFEK